MKVKMKEEEQIRTNRLTEKKALRAIYFVGLALAVMLTAVNGTGIGRAAQQAAASSNDGYIYDDGHLRFFRTTHLYYFDELPFDCNNNDEGIYYYHQDGYYYYVCFDVDDIDYHYDNDDHHDHYYYYFYDDNDYDHNHRRDHSWNDNDHDRNWHHDDDHNGKWGDKGDEHHEH